MQHPEMLLFSVIFIFTLFGGVGADLLSCETQQIPLDPVTNPSFDMDSQMMASLQHCVWNFTFPEGYMADVQVNGAVMYYMDIVTLYSHFDGNAGLYQRITYQGNDSKPSSCFVHIMWPEGQFELDVHTVDQTQMILTVHVKLVKLQMMTGEIFTTIKNGQPKYVQLFDWPVQKAYEVYSGGAGVSLSVVLPEYTDLSSLANFFVYEEDDNRNLIFRGTFHTYYADLNVAEIKPNGKQITIYRAMQDGIVGTVIVNDQDNTKNVDFQSHWSPYNMADFNYSQSHYIAGDSSKGLIGAITIVNQDSGANAIYFTGVEFKSDDATAVKVIAGGMVADYMKMGTYLGSYNESNTGLPVFLPGMARTFIIEKGGAVVSTTVRSSLAHYSDAVNGRSGFLISNNYPFSSPNQNSDDFVLKSLNADPFTFTYTITDQNPTPKAYLNVTLLGENGRDVTVESNHVVDLNTVIPGEFKYTAKKMTLTIFGGNGISTGMKIPYRVASTADQPPVELATTKVAPPLSSVTSSSSARSMSTTVPSGSTIVGSTVSSSSTKPSTTSTSTVSSTKPSPTVVTSTGPSTTVVATTSNVASSSRFFSTTGYTIPHTSSLRSDTIPDLESSTVLSASVSTPPVPSPSPSQSHGSTISSTVIPNSVGVTGGDSSNGSSTLPSSAISRSTTPSGMDSTTSSGSAFGALLIATVVMALLA